MYPKWSEERKRKQSLFRKELYAKGLFSMPSNLGRKMSQETKNKLSLIHKRLYLEGKIKPPSWKGKKASLETRLKMSQSHGKGEANHNWKGDKVGYSGVHRWVESRLGRPNKCINKLCSKKSVVFEWCNISHSYKRELNDWVRLCRSCHRKYDLGIAMWKDEEFG